MATSSPPFSADALNRFRMSHSDKDVRALARRLNRLPYQPEEDTDAERTLARLEAQKWRFSVERQLASVRSLERQAGNYDTLASETAARNDKLKTVMAEEKALLAQALAERDQRMKCDDAARRIVARTRSSAELDEQLATLEASIAEQRAHYEAVLAVAEARAEAFGKITALVDECRGLKLPPWSGEEEPPEPEAPRTLSAVSLPFQPAAGSSSGAGAGAGSSSSAAAGGSTGVGGQAAGSSAGGRAPASAPVSRAGSASPHPSLPQRPGARNAQSSRYAPAARGLPPRPSGLRYSNAKQSSLEDGEVGEDEDERRGSKRKAEEARPERSTRRK